jgi:hypothetical protein
VNVTHWYHVWSMGEWREPVAEHLWALDAGGFDGPFHVGIVGSEDQRAEVVDELNAVRKPDGVVGWRQGWEQPTIGCLHEWAKCETGAVLYAHTKGAYTPSTINVAWRRSMQHHLIRGWRAAAENLETYEAVGCHWLTPEEFPANVGSAPLPCFGGNYWLARNDYLRRLPACENVTRHDAEGWVGQLRPRVLDLTPGWPGDFGPVKYGRLIAGR